MNVRSGLRRIASGASLSLPRNRKSLGFESLEPRRVLSSVSIPVDLTGEAGEQILVPINIDDAEEVRAVEVEISYDTELLGTDSSSVTAGSVWATGSSEVNALVDSDAGTIVVWGFATEGLGPGSGSLLQIEFTIGSDVLPGDSVEIDLVEVALNEGTIIVDPEPQPGEDSTDGLITFGGIEDTAGISVSPTTGLTTSETGGTTMFTVALDSQPTGEVTITLATSDETEGMVSPGVLTFTANDWNQPQTVTVSPVNDDFDDGDVTYSISTSVTTDDPKYQEVDRPSVTVTNMDDDAAGIRVSPTSGLATSEAGDADQFSVVLESEPTADVRIVVYSDDMEEGTASPSALVFTAENWAEPQIVTVTGVGDSVDDGDATYTVSLWPASSQDDDYRGINPDDVTVTNLDLDTAGFSVDWLTQAVTTEGGGSATFELMLDTEPMEDVTVYLSSGDATEGELSPQSLVFSTLDWNEPRTVRVFGVDDDVIDGDVGYSIRVSVSSDDTAYGALPPQDVSITNRDDDTAGITVTPTSGLATDETHGTATFTVALTSEPTADVTVGVATDDSTEGTVGSTALVFTPTTWQQPQTVTVTGVDDHVDDDDVTYTIVTAAAVSSDPSYSGFDAADVSVTNVDNETFIPVELGEVDFTRLESLDPSSEDLWFRLETAHDGWLTVQAIAELTAEELTIRVFEPTTLAVPVATSTLQDGRPRLDYGVQQGQTYLLQVTGTASDAGLLVANLVHEADGVVTVHGTAGDDLFRFEAAASREISINEVAYHYEDAEVSTVEFVGGDGRDEAWLYDSAGDETLEAWPNRASFTNGAGDGETDFAVQVSGIEGLLGYATRGGTDSAIFHGSEGGDKLKSYEDSVRLRAKDSSYALRGKKFATIVADAGDGGKDLAVFNGTDGDETFTYLGADGSATVEGEQRNHSAVGFASVTARAGGDGNDVAHFTDIPGTTTDADDVFYFRSHKTQLVGAEVKITVRAFDQVYANASESGFDVARIYDTTGDDHLEVEGSTARLYRRVGDDLELLYEVVAFERAKCYSTGGNDTTDVQDHVVDLHLYDWDE